MWFLLLLLTVISNIASYFRSLHNDCAIMANSHASHKSQTASHEIWFMMQILSKTDASDITPSMNIYDTAYAIGEE
jgi:hypothetical protein